MGSVAVTDVRHRCQSTELLVLSLVNGTLLLLLLVVVVVVVVVVVLLLLLLLL